jgi:hypothetical protein
MHRFLFLSLAIAGCAAGPTTGDIFGGTTNGSTRSFFGYTDMKLTPVTAYVQTKPYCPPTGGAWTQIGSGTTSASPLNLNDSRAAYQWNITSGALSSAQWKQGGVARFKARSKINGGSAPTDLLGFDTDGPACAYDEIQQGSSWVAAGNDCQSPYPHNEVIHVVSTTPDPTTQHFGDIAYLGVRGGAYPGAPVTPASTVDESANYYASIGAPLTLAAFKTKYGFPGNEVRAVYYNDGDLGVGRDMHCKTAAIGGGNSTACYVGNYGRRTSPPLAFAGFGSDPQTAIDQILGPQGIPGVSSNAPVATVAMVHDSTKPADQRVQFMVYNELGDLTEQAALDNPGVEALKHQTTASAANTAVPDNCLTCHGTSSSYTPAASGTSVVHGARFLPFDPDNFIYSTNNATWSKASTLPKLKQLNALVWDTGMTTSTQELLRGMYPAASNLGPKDAAAVFDPTFIPTGWTDVPGESKAAKQVYTEVVKPFCRTCHVSHDTTDWNTYQEFKDAAGYIGYYVCNQNSTVPMPQAERVQSKMWATGARAHLLAAFQLTGACTPIEAPPAAPVCP